MTIKSVEPWVGRARGEPEQRGDEHEVTFLSFRYHTLQVYTHETGMQFCRFECTNEVSSVRKTSLNLLDNALMLPYSKMGFPFQRLLWCILIGMFFCVITMILIAIRDPSQCISLCSNMYSCEEILHLYL